MRHEREVDITTGIATIKNRIHTTCKHYDRNPDHITLITVSKHWPASDLRIAWQQGIRCFGESYIQEAIDKIHQLDDLDIEWHFIGPIQSNKTRLLAEHFAWVHSLSSIKHARRIHEQRPHHLPPIQACLQVNISQEISKSGISPDEATTLAHEINALSNIKLRGLMAIPARSESLKQQRQAFHQLCQLQQQLNSQGLTLDTLSMGMSDDLEAAIAEGSTTIRIGNAIFGARQ